MNQEQRLEVPKARHDALEAIIATKATKPTSDDLEIVTLKKEKLRIKDRIAQLAR